MKSTVGPWGFPFRVGGLGSAVLGFIVVFSVYVLFWPAFLVDAVAHVRYIRHGDSIDRASYPFGYWGGYIPTNTRPRRAREIERRLAWRGAR